MYVPAAIGVIHRADTAVELAGYTIPADTLIITNIHGVHRDPDYWTDPDMFRPERWLDDENNIIRHDSYMPFSLGMLSNT